jgi:hypothetical protein
MAKATRTLAAGVVTALAIAVAVRPAAAQDAQAAHVMLRVRNDAQVPGDLLAAAEAMVTTTFAQAGIAARFTGTAADLMIVLLSRHTAANMHQTSDAVGFAPGSETARGTIAYVLEPRVNAIADGYTTARPIVLAAAMAHEVGHLLMFKAHSSVGIMRADWSQTDFRQAVRGNLLFTTEQAAQMRAALSGSVARPVVRPR